MVTHCVMLRHSPKHFTGGHVSTGRCSAIVYSALSMVHAGIGVVRRLDFDLDSSVSQVAVPSEKETGAVEFRSNCHVAIGSFLYILHD